MEDADVPVNFLSGPHRIRLKGCSLMMCCGDDSFEVYIELVSFTYRAS